MPEFTVSRTIDASADEVWAELADFGNIYVWNPGVTESFLTSDTENGVGATRHCSLKPAGAIQERITEWEPGSRLKINIYEFAKVPMKDAHADFRLEDLGDGTTKVDMHYEYELTLLGKLMPASIMRNQLMRGLGGLLKGLDQHVANAGA